MSIQHLPMSESLEDEVLLSRLGFVMIAQNKVCARFNLRPAFSTARLEFAHAKSIQTFAYHFTAIYDAVN